MGKTLDSNSSTRKKKKSVGEDVEKLEPRAHSWLECKNGTAAIENSHMAIPQEN
jgi:hypothetical protein